MTKAIFKGIVLPDGREVSFADILSGVVVLQPAQLAAIAEGFKPTQHMQLHEVLVTNYELPLAALNEGLEKALTVWMGDYPDAVKCYKEAFNHAYKMYPQVSEMDISDPLYLDSFLPLTRYGAELLTSVLEIEASWISQAALCVEAQDLEAQLAQAQEKILVLQQKLENVSSELQENDAPKEQLKDTPDENEEGDFVEDDAEADSDPSWPDSFDEDGDAVSDVVIYTQAALEDAVRQAKQDRNQYYTGYVSPTGLSAAKDAATSAAKKGMFTKGEAQAILEIVFKGYLAQKAKGISDEALSEGIVKVWGIKLYAPRKKAEAGVLDILDGLKKAHLIVDKK